MTFPQNSTRNERYPMGSNHHYTETKSKLQFRTINSAKLHTNNQYDTPSSRTVQRPLLRHPCTFLHVPSSSHVLEISGGTSTHIQGSYRISASGVGAVSFAATQEHDATLAIPTWTRDDVLSIGSDRRPNGDMLSSPFAWIESAIDRD
jgi:hypothetical protein